VIVPRPGNFGRGEEDIYPAEAFHIYEGGKKEELPLGVKIIGVAICIGAVVLLATYDRLLKMLRLKKSKTK